MGRLKLSLFGSSIDLDIASTTVDRPVHLTWTYEKTDSPDWRIPEANIRSSRTFLVLLCRPHMHQIPAKNDLGCIQIYTYTQWPLESWQVLAFLPLAPQ